MTAPIQFLDGAAYERGMGTWSRLVGTDFLRWLDPAPGLRWVDVGCGNGAFTELVMAGCAPASVDGVDPSDGQLDYARTRPGAAGARFHRGTGDALPLPDGSVDVAAMALSIFFMPDPAAGLAEARRVVRPGGTVAAYAWDLPARSFPLEPIQAELRALGKVPTLPPSAAVASVPALRAAFAAAGLTGLRERTIAVTREFPDFSAFWEAALGTGTLREAIAALPAEARDGLEARVARRLTAGEGAAVRYTASANAIAGSVPG